LTFDFAEGVKHFGQSFEPHFSGRHRSVSRDKRSFIQTVCE
jgi:hypothetical protein